MFEWIIIGLVLLYCVFIIIRKVKDIKKGKYCSCGCSECPAKNKCHK